MKHLRRRYWPAVRGSCLLAEHLYQLWRSGQLRFRLETFGLYYPTLPYQSPWWRITPRLGWLLIRRRVAYARWLDEMATLKRGDGSAWWKRYGNSS